MGRKGSALVWAVTSMLVLMILAAAVLAAGGAYARRSINDNASRQAYLTARSAVDAMIAHLEATPASTLVPSPAVNFTDLGPLPGTVTEASATWEDATHAHALLTATAKVGNASETVTARMKLTKGGGGGGDSPAWDYRIFADTISFGAHNIDIGGSIHSNGNLSIGWGSGNISGTAEAHGTRSIASGVSVLPGGNTDDIPMPNLTDYVNSVKIPDIVMPPPGDCINVNANTLGGNNYLQYWNEDMYVTGGDVTVNHGVVINSDVYIMGGSLTIKGGGKLNGNLYVRDSVEFQSGGADIDGGYIYAGQDITIKACHQVKGNLYADRDISFPNGADYIEGNVFAKGNISATGFLTLKGTFSAGGTIYLSSGAKIGGNLFANGNISFPSGFTADPAVMLCVYSAQGDINRVYTTDTIDGVICAPGGTVTISDKVTLNGSIVGKEVSGSASQKLQMGVSKFDFPFLGGSDKWEFVQYE